MLLSYTCCVTQSLTHGRDSLPSRSRRLHPLPLEDLNAHFFIMRASRLCSARPQRIDVMRSATPSLRTRKYSPPLLLTPPAAHPASPPACPPPHRPQPARRHCCPRHAGPAFRCRRPASSNTWPSPHASPPSPSPRRPGAPASRCH